MDSLAYFMRQNHEQQQRQYHEQQQQLRQLRRQQQHQHDLVNASERVEERFVEKKTNNETNRWKRGGANKLCLQI